MPIKRVVALFLITFFFTSSVAYAASGFLNVYARNNKVEIVSKGGGAERFSISISSDSKQFGEEVSDAINVQLKTNEFTEGGKLQIRNESGIAGIVRPKVIFTSGEKTAEKISLKVTDQNNKVLYDGTLADYGHYGFLDQGKNSTNLVIQNGDFNLAPKETKVLTFHLKVGDVLYPAGTSNVGSHSKPVVAETMKFDLQFSAVEYTVLDTNK